MTHGKLRRIFNEAAAKNFDGTIRGNVTFFYGECPECIDSKNINRNYYYFA